MCEKNVDIWWGGVSVTATVDDDQSKDWHVEMFDLSDKAASISAAFF